MKAKYILSAIYIFTLSWAINAQKALPVQINSLLARIPAPQNSEANFHGCTIETDETTGIVQVKDAGPIVNEIQSTLERDMKDLGNGTMAVTYAASSAPSSEQIAQMQQQAMQMQGMSPQEAMQMAHKNSILPMDNPALMHELGKAQNAVMQINMFINELNSKAAPLGGEYHRKIDLVKPGDPCPDVKVPGADIAVPTCECKKDRSLDYYKRRITVENDYINQIDALLQSYLPKIRSQIAIIDDAEKDLKYGDAVNSPPFKNQVAMLQQQAFGALAPILGMVSGILKDSATEYANIVNTENGTLIGCHK